MEMALLWSNFQAYTAKLQDEDISGDKLVSYANEILDDLKAADYEDTETMKIVMSVELMYENYKTKGMRNLVVEVLLDKGFPVMAVDILKLYKFRYESYTQNPKQWIPRALLAALHNFTDVSIKFGKALIDVGIVGILLENLTYKPYLDKQNDEYVQNTLSSSLGVLHNAGKVPDVKQHYRDLNAVQIIMPFTGSSNVRFKMVSMMILTDIMTDEENMKLEDKSGAIPFIVKFLANALKDTDKRQHEGFHPLELAEGLASLAANDSNKTTIVKAGALPLFVSMMKYHDTEEQICAATALWTLSFDTTSRDLIKEEPGCIEALQNLQKSDDPKVRKEADGALWVIMEKDSGRIDQNSEQQEHVFLSYSWDYQDRCIQIKNKLKSQGYRVWMDVDEMSGSTLEAMASAVENASVVLICACEKYKESPNCRTEAKYTYDCNKDYIPIIMKRKYKADGWLGAMIATKLYIDFEKYDFNNSYERLVKEIGTRGKAKAEKVITRELVPVTTTLPPPSVEPDPVEATTYDDVDAAPIVRDHIPATPRVTGKAVTLSEKSSPAEVAQWLTNNDLTRLHTVFAHYDGMLVLSLKRVQTSAPDHFYTTLRDDMHLNLIDRLAFSDALDAVVDKRVPRSTDNTKNSSVCAIL